MTLVPSGLPPDPVRLRRPPRGHGARGRRDGIRGCPVACAAV